MPKDEDWGDPEVEEYVPLDIPADYRELVVRRESLSVRQVWEKYTNGQIVLEPDFQRHYVWDRQRASRFVESLLLSLPIPPLFVSEEPDGAWVVIDGHQRFETIFRFLKPLLAGPSKSSGAAIPSASLPPLTLSSLEVLSEFNGRDIQALGREDRRCLWDTDLPLVILGRDTHRDMKYVLFSRLNLGSMSLNAQELRNCLYRGPYNRLIAQLSERPDFLRLWGRVGPDKRMRHRELVLRFFAFLHRRERYRTPFRAFLNDEMEEFKNASKGQLAGFRKEFDTAVTWSDRVFRNEVFRLFAPGAGPEQPSGRWGRRRLDLLYEVATVGFAHVADKLDEFWQSAAHEDRRLFVAGLRYRLIDVMIRPSFRTTLNERTKDPSFVEDRFRQWILAVENATSSVEDVVKEARSLELAIDRRGLCSECDFPVTPDDAAAPTQKGLRECLHRYCRSN